MSDGERANVLVTGGAGFLGSHLCRRLLGEGKRVTCLDNFRSGRRSAIADFLSHPHFRLIEHDVVDPLPALPKFDLAYNLACPASPPLYQRDPVHTLRTCVQGTYNVLEAARRHGAMVLQASTSEVYGDPNVDPQCESYRGNVNPVGPRACYDEGKRAAETLISDYVRQGLLRCKIVRIFNTYGPGMAPDDGRVVSTFAMQALMGRPLTVYGDGSQVRSLCYVDDLIDGLVRMTATDPSWLGPVNLGNPDPQTVVALALRIRALAGSESEIEYRPLPQDDPLQRCPDITLARQRLGWKPRVTLDSGIELTLRYFRSLLAEEVEAGAAGSAPAGYKASWD